MKSEERHELQENELAGWIYHVPALLNKYGSHLLFAVALIILAFQGYAWYQRRQANQQAEAWAALAEASTPGTANPPLKLQNLMSTCDIKPVQAMAAVALGDFYLDTLTLGGPPPGSGVPVRPEVADHEAEKAYEAVLKDYADQDLAVVRARLGLGKVYEYRAYADQNAGQADKAAAEWKQAAEQYDLIPKMGTPVAQAFTAYAQERKSHLQEWAQPVTFGAPLPAETMPAGETVGPPAPAATSPH